MTQGDKLEIGIMKLDKNMSFDKFEQSVEESVKEQMVALEFYKNLVSEFEWENNYSISKNWADTPSMMIHDIACYDVEFLFGEDKLRLIFNRITFVIPINDKHIEAVEKIISVLGYCVD